MIEKEMKKLENTIRHCKLCQLHKNRKNPVLGEGSLKPKVFFIGEAPGKNEDIKGRPFVGSAGKIFDKLLKSIDLKREDIYITNVVKCHPPGNRKPTKEEIEKCSRYLEKQISLIKPRIIATLGNVALQWICKKFEIKLESISSVHGKIVEIKTDYDKVYFIPLYHPAFAVYNPNMINVLLRDMRKILLLL
jgi:DNA polymerase